MPQAVKVSPEWSRHLKGKDKEDFDYYVANSRQLLLRLDEIIDERIAAIGRREDDEEYASPSWPYLQADRIGQVKAYNQLKKLIKGSLNNVE